MPVYNEIKYIKKTISSVLEQSFQDFEFIISDNHSTDGSSDVIREFAEKDKRIKVVSPPFHMKSLDHLKWLFYEILNNKIGYKYSILIGGHDLWDPGLLHNLFFRAENEKNISIVYPGAYEIDDSGNRLRRYCDWLMVKDVPRPFVPHHVLLGITYNVCMYGLWLEEKRKVIKIRHSCSGADHLLVAEMALLGSVIYESSGIIYLGKGRDYAQDLTRYEKKHVANDDPVKDFSQQLEWASYLVDQAVKGDPFYSQGQMKSFIKTSMLSAYIGRYVGNLTYFENGIPSFFSNPLVWHIVQANDLLSGLFDDLLLVGKSFPGQN
jgi:glycosyltransferase involved in cell wall biosynthesis